MDRRIATLDLADGSRWGIAAQSASAVPVLLRLIEVMKLGFDGTPQRQLAISVADSPPRGSRWAAGEDGAVNYVMEPLHSADLLAIRLMELTSLIGLEAEIAGGLLLHGALAERGGQGVLLAGPGGAGKTTASARLPPPWRSLCDDATLVVRDAGGRYWAHPWPTWSRFMFGEPGGSWDVQRAVPLRGLFFLVQDEEDRAEPVGAGRAATLLVEVAEQVLAPMQRGMAAEKLRALRVRRFDNICALAKAVPCYELHLSRRGAFWEEMERVLDGEGAG